MSFYFDDEPQVHTNNEHADERDDEHNAFVCVNCGGSTYYVDEASGVMCCDSCFTQSQQLTAEASAEQLDVEEVQALAARTRSGRVIKSSASNKRGRGGTAYVPQQKKPLPEYDSSTPFPNLITCLHGIQQVMKHCVEPLCDLVGLSVEADVVQETVRKLWMSYLRAWTDGAEFYGKLHPEIRFSMRDYFLPNTYRQKVMQHLSYKARQVVRAELDAQQEEKKEDRTVSDEIMSETESNDIQDYSSLTKGHQYSIRYFGPTYHHPRSLMWMYWHNGKRGRLEAALITPPSMNLVSCVLWLAVSRAGVTLNHVLRWIANGALPLQNAFKHCLSQEERQALFHVSSFFRLTKLPTMTEMENLTERLVVACGLKSFSHLHGIPPGAAARRELRSGPDNVLSNGARKAKGTTVEPIGRPNFSYVTPRSVPLLTARLIQDLGFDKHILDRTLALMGILKEAPSNVWHPGPLQGAHPGNLATAAQVLSVIAVACRMTPGWETWAYPGPAPPCDDNVGLDSDDDVIDFQERGREAKRRRLELEGSRFVPYNEEHVRLLRNGPLVEGYLDYLEEHMLEENTAIFPRFRSTLDSSRWEKTKRTGTDVVGIQDIVQKQSVMRESCNPFGPERIWRRQKSHDWKLQLKRKRARWADANGLGEYVIYSDPDTHAKETRRVGKLKRIAIPEPFHPQYGLLVEYMSYKTNVRPSDIHAAVVVLDAEVLRLVRPQEEVKLTRSGPRKAKACQVSVSTNSVAVASTQSNETARKDNSEEDETIGDGAHDLVLSSSNDVVAV